VNSTLAETSLDAFGVQSVGNWFRNQSFRHTAPWGSVAIGGVSREAGADFSSIESAGGAPVESREPRGVGEYA
jgi:hypothetical protein